MQKITISLAEAFGFNGTPLQYIPAEIVVVKTIWEDGDNEELKKLVPTVDPNYRFPKEAIRDFRMWLDQMTEPLFLFGPTGSGKSSFVTQAYARLGLPLFRMTISASTEETEIFGHYTMSEGGATVFRYGPASLAAKHGFPLLLDEFGRGNPDKLVGLNGLFEAGEPFVITGNGETIVPAEGFRIILTDNTNLCGDETGNYNTSNIQDKSLLDRIGMTIQMTYPEEEKELLSSKLDELFDDKLFPYWLDQEGIQVTTDTGVKKGSDVSREEFLQAIVQFRDMVRKQSRDGGNQTSSALERTISVRGLLRWLTYCKAFFFLPNLHRSALHYGLERGLTNTCTASTKIAIHAMVKTVFGVSEKLN